MDTALFFSGADSQVLTAEQFREEFGSTWLY
jgi:hypothetical protein